MKSIFALVFALLITDISSAAYLTCVDQNAGPDHGYSLKFSKKLEEVQVSQVTIAGPKVLALLECKIPKMNPDMQNQFQTLLTCSDPTLFDAGFSLVVRAGGFTNAKSATLSTITIAGARDVAEFSCR